MDVLGRGGAQGRAGLVGTAAASMVGCGAGRERRRCRDRRAAESAEYDDADGVYDCENGVPSVPSDYWDMPWGRPTATGT